MTSTPIDVAWSNTHVVDGYLVEFARKLKERLETLRSATSPTGKLLVNYRVVR